MSRVPRYLAVHSGGGLSPSSPAKLLEPEGRRLAKTPAIPYGGNASTENRIRNRHRVGDFGPPGAPDPQQRLP